MTEKNKNQQQRREFLILASSAMGAIGLGSFAWPFLKSMNPAADVLALSTLDIDLSPIAEGQAITVMWRGRPLFIRHRTKKEIAAARAIAPSDLLDPEEDTARFKKNPQW